MNNHQTYCINAPVHFSSVSLISAYNAHTYGEHHNSFITRGEQYEMYCMVFTLEGNAKIVLKNGREFKLHKNSVFSDAIQISIIWKATANTGINSPIGSQF